MWVSKNYVIWWKVKSIRIRFSFRKDYIIFGTYKKQTFDLLYFNDTWMILMCVFLPNDMGSYQWCVTWSLLVIFCRTFRERKKMNENSLLLWLHRYLTQNFKHFNTINHNASNMLYFFNIRMNEKRKLAVVLIEIKLKCRQNET